MLKYIYLFSKGGTKMESTLLINKIELLLANSDLKGISTLLSSLNSRDKKVFDNYCQRHNLKYNNYPEVIESLQNKSRECLIDSIYRLQGYSIRLDRTMNIRIDLLNQLSLQSLIIKDNIPKTEALILVRSEELQMRLDLMSEKSFWINSENISRCWDIVESLSTPDSAILLRRSMINRLSTITLNFVAKDKKHRMRRLKPSHVLIEHVTRRIHFFSKRRRILERWQKARKK
jgi:hypothetical protein